MKKKLLLFIVLNFCILTLCKIEVQAKIIVPDEIEDNSYVIGKYLYTRSPNNEYNYDGVLDTAKMLLAAKTIDGGLDEMVVYYKDFLGNWINGSTGESITPPSYFEIENRNLRDILPTPDLECRMSEDYDCIDGPNGTKVCDGRIDCASSVSINGNTNYYATNNPHQVDSNISDFNGGVEFYILKNEDGTLPEQKAYYDVSTGKFKANNKNLKLVLVGNSDWDFTYYDGIVPFYQIVSRFYYLDGNVKIYSEYSDIQTNGAYTKFGITRNTITTYAKVNTDYSVKVDSSYGSFGPGINSEVNYYNVKFHITGIDTSKYMVQEYRVYSEEPAVSGYSYDHRTEINNAENGNTTFETLYVDGLVQPKYKTPRRVLYNLSSFDAYLIANISGLSGLGDYSDMSNTMAYSKRLFWSDDTNARIYVKGTVCNLSQTECYEFTSIGRV